MARHLLPSLGHLHAGRRRRRHRRQKRRREGRALFHGSHPHPQRPSHQHTSPHHRRSLRSIRQRRRRYHCPPEYPAPLGGHRKSSRGPRSPVVRRPHHHRRLRRRHPQHHRLPRLVLLPRN